MRGSDVFRLLTERLTIGSSGGYVAGSTGGAQVVSVTVKYLSGGTLEILGTSAQTAGTGYLMGTSEALTFGGPTAFFLSSTGATSIVALIRSIDASDT